MFRRLLKILVLLFVLTCSESLTSYANGSFGYLGDTNQDKTWNAQDFAELKELAVRWKRIGAMHFNEPPTMEAGMSCDDWNGNGEICDYQDRRLYHFSNIDDVMPLTADELNGARLADLNFDQRIDHQDLWILYRLEQIGVRLQAATERGVSIEALIEQTGTSFLLPEGQDYLDLTKLRIDLNAKYGKPGDIPNPLVSHPIVSRQTLASLVIMATVMRSPSATYTAAHPFQALDVILSPLASHSVVHRELAAGLIVDAMWSQPLAIGESMRSNYRAGVVNRELDQSIARELAASVLSHREGVLKTSLFGELKPHPFTRRRIEGQRLGGRSSYGFPEGFMRGYYYVAIADDTRHKWQGKQRYLSWPLVLTDRPGLSLISTADFRGMRNVGEDLRRRADEKENAPYPFALLQERLVTVDRIEAEAMAGHGPHAIAYGMYLQQWRDNDPLARFQEPYSKWQRQVERDLGKPLATWLDVSERPLTYMDWISAVPETAVYVDSTKQRELIGTAMEYMGSDVDRALKVSALLARLPHLGGGHKQRVYSRILQVIADQPDTEQDRVAATFSRRLISDIATIYNNGATANLNNWIVARTALESIRTTVPSGEQIFRESTVMLGGLLPIEFEEQRLIGPSLQSPAQWLADLNETEVERHQRTASQDLDVLHSGFEWQRLITELYSSDPDIRWRASQTLENKFATGTSQGGGVVLADGNNRFYVLTVRGELVRLSDSAVNVKLENMQNSADFNDDAADAMVDNSYENLALNDPVAEERFRKAVKDLNLGSPQGLIGLLLGDYGDNRTLGRTNPFVITTSSESVARKGKINQFDNLRQLRDEPRYDQNYVSSDDGVEAQIVWTKQQDRQVLTYDEDGRPIQPHLYLEAAYRDLGLNHISDQCDCGCAFRFTEPFFTYKVAKGPFSHPEESPGFVTKSWRYLWSGLTTDYDKKYYDPYHRGDIGPCDNLTYAEHITTKWFFHIDMFLPLFLDLNDVMLRVQRAGGVAQYFDESNLDELETFRAQDLYGYSGKLELTVTRRFLLRFTRLRLAELFVPRSRGSKPIDRFHLLLDSQDTEDEVIFEKANEQMQLRPASLVKFAPASNVISVTMVMRNNPNVRIKISNIGLADDGSLNPVWQPVLGGLLLNQPVVYDIYLRDRNGEQLNNDQNLKAVSGSTKELQIVQQTDGFSVSQVGAATTTNWQDPEIRSYVNAYLDALFASERRQ